jgi:AraC-like DNA-binding protein
MHDSESTEFGLTHEKVGARELLRGQFRDFDELSASAAGWDLDFVQLDAGQAASCLTQVVAPGVSIQRFRFGHTFFQRGASSPDMCTFGLAESEPNEVSMFGGELTASDLALFRMGGEFESVSPPGFTCVAISVHPDLLEEAFAAIEMPWRRDPSAAESGPLAADPKALQRLRLSATQILDSHEATMGALDRSELMHELTFQLPIDVALAIQSADGAPRRAETGGRDRAFRRAVAMIEDRLEDEITIRGLCEELEVGWTTLVQAFRENLGVTPKVYLRTLRLNRVRRDLLDAAPASPIADAANRSGFWHMGQFAADYRRLFGELPSDTKSRVLAPGPGDSSRLA